ncbi:hypothetical protein KSC_067810 [Ktedonobacter sp. SOSP1-52]|uniref:hypothetical protein n=1 Tax=Ktedonobacter sp. SOSP1-52 TaxID=2778366 RepID=UPI00191653A7|nr:hypothetical protein [Ktedonobacter sp. SOSP1-52]GHO67889.1 hypothetical protein KSC_067810 [Ktedonobacter sp. SOSP1-52]
MHSVDDKNGTDKRKNGLFSSQKNTPYVEVRFGIKPDALNVGGINLFGEKFGNYP